MYRKVKLGAKNVSTGRGLTTATALQYDPSQSLAPVVVATGKGKIAEQILSLACANDIPVYDDPMLSIALSNINLGEEIPPELYLVVAEVLAYIYRVYGQLKQNKLK